MDDEAECTTCAGTGRNAEGDDICMDCYKPEPVTPKNKGGRPPAGDKLRKQHPIRFSDEEKAIITEAAALEGAEFGTWLRNVGLSRAKLVIDRENNRTNLKG